MEAAAKRPVVTRQISAVTNGLRQTNVPLANESANGALALAMMDLWRAIASIEVTANLASVKERRS